MVAPKRRQISIYGNDCLLRVPAGLPKIGGDEVGDPGLGRDAELADCVLGGPVGVCHATWLPLAKRREMKATLDGR